MPPDYESNEHETQHEDEAREEGQGQGEALVVTAAAILLVSQGWSPCDAVDRAQSLLDVLRNRGWLALLAG